MRAVIAAGVSEVSRQVDQILGGYPVPGSSEWERISGTAEERERELWAQLLGLRIEIAAGIDPLLTVVGLRRWGASWQAIAEATGTSRQAAHERWGRQVTQILDRYQTGDMGGPVADDAELSPQ